MSASGFYSRREQFFREWRLVWRSHGVDALLGSLYVIAGFYVAHQVGVSQVYNVIAPFIIASIVVGYLAFAIYAPQSRGNTLPFYFNLPRSRTAAWDAYLAFLACTVLWMEGLILIGVMLKLGGAAMTPHYRLHPEAFGLPFLAIASVSSYLHARHSKRYVAAFVLVFVAFMVGLYYWITVGFWEDAEQFNNFYPPRAFALGHQYAVAALLLVSAGLVLALRRRQWRRREVGEIQ